MGFDLGVAALVNTPLHPLPTKEKQMDMPAESKKKPTSDEQFEYAGPRTRLDELFDNHGIRVFHPDDELGAEEEEEENG